MSLRARVLASVVLAAAVPGPSAAQQGATPPAPPADTIVVSLKDMVRIAAGKNLTLRVQRLSGDIAEANVLAARSTFDPSWSLSTNRSTTRTNVVGDTLYRSGTDALALSLSGVLPTSTGYSLSGTASNAFSRPIQSSVGTFTDNYTTGVAFQLTQPLLRGFGPGPATALVRAARQESKAARSDVRRTVEETVARVEGAYWLLRYAETAEQIAQESVDRARSLYDRNVALRKRDMVSQLDVITAERTLADRRTSLLDARQQRDNAADALVFLVYGDGAAAQLKARGALIRTQPENPAVPELADLDSLETMALSQRADAAAARDRLASARTQMDLAHNSLRPELDLTLGLNYGGTSNVLRPFSYPNKNNDQGTVLSIGAAFTLPQFNRSADAAYETATLETEQTRLAVTRVDNDIRSQVRAAVRGVRLDVESLQASDSLVSLARQEYRIARSGLDLGQVSTFQLFQYEEALVQARLTRAEDEYQLATALSAFHLAMGRNTARYGIDLPDGRAPASSPPGR